MTEDEWKKATDAGPMLTWLEAARRVSVRKAQLFYCALRRVSNVRVPRLLSCLENLIDDCPPVRDFLQRRSVLLHDLALAQATTGSDDDLQFFAWARSVLSVERITPINGALHLTPLVRELFGNPHRKIRRVSSRLIARLSHLPPERQPTDLLFARDWLTWHDHLIPKFAQGIIADYAFDRMPILGDALEEAGCADDELLNHCRHGGPHVRGCWVLDLLLGKE